MQNLTPISSSLCFVTISSCETEAMLARASPRNPRLEISNRSLTSLILLVAWGAKASSISSLAIPLPLSVIRISAFPPSCISTVTAFAFASIAFSINSLTTAIGRSITSPAAILLIVSWLSRCICAMYPPSFSRRLQPFL